MNVNKEIISRDSSKTITLLVLGVSAITLFISTNSIDPFNTPKLVVLLLISSLFIGRLFNSLKNMPIWISKEVRIIFISIAIFLLTSLVSAFFSDSLFVSFIGDTQRRNGLLAYFGLSLLALTATLFIDFKNLDNLLKISILTGSIFSFYGLIQISGRDFASWDNPYNKVISTVGNPNFASALMAVFTLLSIVSLLSQSLSQLYKIFAALSILMSLTAIIASDSRQGLVSLAFGLMFFASTYLFLKRKIIGSFVISFSVLLSVLAIAGMLQKGPFAPLLYKASVSVRGFYWDAAIEMFKSNPFFGVGLDHYGYYFKEVRSVEFPLRFGFDISSSNAHNAFLQMFATGGFFVGLSYLVIVVLTFFVGISVVVNSSAHKRIISLGILSAWIVFQAQSLISIDNIGISVWGWLLTGTIFGLGRVVSWERKGINTHLYKPTPRNQIRVFPFLITAFFFIPILILSVLLMRIENNTWLSRNLENNLAIQTDKSTILSQQLVSGLSLSSGKVLNSIFADPNYKLQIAYYLFNSGKPEESIRIANGEIKQNSRNLYALEALAIFSTQLNDGLSAIEAREQITSLDPWNAKNYLQLLLLYKATGDTENALLMKEKILSFAPQTNEAKIALEEMTK